MAAAMVDARMSPSRDDERAHSHAWTSPFLINFVLLFFALDDDEMTALGGFLGWNGLVTYSILRRSFRPLQRYPSTFSPNINMPVIWQGDRSSQNRTNLVNKFAVRAKRSTVIRENRRPYLTFKGFKWAPQALWESRCRMRLEIGRISQRHWRGGLKIGAFTIRKLEKYP